MALRCAAPRPCAVLEVIEGQYGIPGMSVLSSETTTNFSSNADTLIVHTTKKRVGTQVSMKLQ